MIKKVLLNPLQLYLNEISTVPLLTRDEEKDLAQRIEKGDEEAKKKLIRANLKFVVSIAKRYIGESSTLTFLDLIQEGNLGLFRATERFDWRRGYRFSTYAKFCIEQRIKRALVEQKKIIRTPFYMAGLISRYCRVRRKLLQKTEKEPRPEEIAAEMGVRIEKILRIREILDGKIFSFGIPLNEQEENVLADFIKDKKATFSFWTERDGNPLWGLLEKIFIELNSLSSREQKILSMRFGLDDGISSTFKEIAAEFGLSKAAIHSIEKKSFGKIRRRILSKAFPGGKNGD